MERSARAASADAVFADGRRAPLHVSGCRSEPGLRAYTNAVFAVCSDPSHIGIPEAYSSQRRRRALYFDFSAFISDTMELRQGVLSGNYDLDIFSANAEAPVVDRVDRGRHAGVKIQIIGDVVTPIDGD